MRLQTRKHPKTIPTWKDDIVADIKVTGGGAPAAQAGKTYTVQSGDTLSKIAKRFYGDANHYHQIAKASGIDNPDRIDVGQEVTLP